MADNDFSSPTHRMQNIAKMHTFLAYAELRGVIHDPRWQNAPISDLQCLTITIEKRLSDLFAIPMTTLVGTLVDLVRLAEATTDGQDEAEFPTV